MRAPTPADARTQRERDRVLSRSPGGGGGGGVIGERKRHHFVERERVVGSVNRLKFFVIGEGEFRSFSLQEKRGKTKHRGERGRVFHLILNKRPKKIKNGRCNARANARREDLWKEKRREKTRRRKYAPRSRTRDDGIGQKLREG